MLTGDFLPTMGAGQLDPRVQEYGLGHCSKCVIENGKYKRGVFGVGRAD